MMKNVFSLKITLRQLRNLSDSDFPDKGFGICLDLLTAESQLLCVHMI